MNGQNEDVAHVISDRTRLLAIQLVTAMHDHSLLENQEYSPGEYSLPHINYLLKPTGNPDQPYKKIIPTSLGALSVLGWRLLDASHWTTKTHGPIGLDNGYRGIILYRSNPEILLLVHRGMQFETPNMANAMVLADTEVPPIVEDALNFCKQALSHARDPKSFVYNSTIVHTGFSLGGFLSQITSTYCNFIYGADNLAYCYDPPGAFLQIQSLGFHNPAHAHDNRSNVHIYVTAPNLVNTATPQYGLMKQIQKYRNFTDGISAAPIEIDLSNAMNFSNIPVAAVGLVTLKLHNQDTLRLDLGNADNFQVFHIQAWPLAENEFITEPSVNPGNIPIDGVKSFVLNISNAYVEYRATVIAINAGKQGVSRIRHKVENTSIVYSEAPVVTHTSDRQLKLYIIQLLIIRIMQNIIINVGNAEDEELGNDNNAEVMPVEKDESSGDQESLSDWSAESMSQRGSPLSSESSARNQDESIQANTDDYQGDESSSNTYG